MATDRPLTDREAIEKRLIARVTKGMEFQAGKDIAVLLGENARLRERVEDARPLLREAVVAFANVYNVSINDTDIAWWVDAWWQNRLPDTEVERLREADRD